MFENASESEYDIDHYSIIVWYETNILFNLMWSITQFESPTRVHALQYVNEIVDRTKFDSSSWKLIYRRIASRFIKMISYGHLLISILDNFI